MRRTNVIAVSALLTIFAAGDLAGEPSRLNYGDIPFGQPSSTVLQLLDGAKIEEADSPYFEVAGDYGGATPYLSGGMYHFTLTGVTVLNSQAVTLYDVRYEGWETVESMRLYFHQAYGTDGDDGLLAVHKVLRASPGKAEDVYRGLAGSVTEALGVRPIRRNVRYADFLARGQGRSVPAYTAEWETFGTVVYLLIPQDSWTTGASKVDLIYVDTNEWDKYLASCVAHKAAEALKAQTKGSEAAKDF